MGYGQDLESSARRHLAAAQHLTHTVSGSPKNGHKAVAGYLFGMAGELALKQIMRRDNIRPLPSNERRSDPYYAHFPALITLIKDQLTSKAQKTTLTCISDASLFQGWSTDMRYAPSADISEKSVELWKAQAEKLIQVMDTIA